MAECALCRGAAADAELGRIQVWEDDLWRLTTSIGPGDPTPAFSYLEPKRHIPHITDLDGREAATLGSVLARCSGALKAATGCELIYVYVFGGGIHHLHLHLAPHSTGDALSDAMIKGELERHELPSGAVALVSMDYPAIRQEELRRAAARVREELSIEV